jgi:hypothetical protein
MACTGSNPTLDSSSATGANCTNTITGTVSAPCGSSGYYINFYRAPNIGGDPLGSGQVQLSSTALPAGPFSSVSYSYVDTPPCGRGAWTYAVTISCGPYGTYLASSGVLTAPAQGGAADITFADVQKDVDCNNTTRCQISKPCGECAGTAKLFRNGVQIYSAAVPAGPLIGYTLTYIDTPGDGTWDYIWKVYNENGTIDDESSILEITDECHIFVYDPNTTALPTGQMEKQIVLVRVQKNSGVYEYTDLNVLNLEEQRMEWWYHKNGGCGSFRLLTHQDFTGIITDDANTTYEVHVRIKLGGEYTYTTWYRGIVRHLKVEEQGQEFYTEIRGYGYVELLDNIIVQRKYPAGWRVQDVVNDIIVNYIKPNSRIVRPHDVDPTNGDYGYDASTYVLQNDLHFECSALKALKFLAELQGNREFGVDAHGYIYFRTNSTSILYNFYLANDLVKRVSGGKTFTQANDIKIGGKAFGGSNFLQNRADVTDITRNGLYESAAEIPWVTGDGDASQWADNIITKNKQTQEWCEFIWKNVTFHLDASHPIGKIKVYGDDISNDVVEYDIAKIMYVEGGWITKQEVREIGSPSIQPELDQQLLKATIYGGYYPRDLTEEIEVRLKEQIEFLKGKNRQYRYPNDVTNLTLQGSGKIPGELIHYSKDVTNNDVTNNPAELQDLTNPRGIPLTWLSKQWTKLSPRRSFNTLPSRGLFIGEIVTLQNDVTGFIYWWNGVSWQQVGSGAGGGTTTGSTIMEGARVQKTTDTTISAGGSTISFDTILANDNGVFSIGQPTRLTAQNNGYYAISANTLWDKGINGTYRELRIKKTSGATNTIIAKDRRDDFVHNVQRANSIDTVILLLAGDYIELIADTDAVDAGNTVKTSYSTGEFSALFSMALVSTGNAGSSAVGNPTGPAGHDLSGTYPSPTVRGLQDVTLPETPVADGFLKRNAANTGWEEVDATNIKNRFIRGGLNQIRIDEWADPTNTSTACDVTNNPTNIHGLVPKPTGWKLDALWANCQWHPPTEENVYLQAVWQGVSVPSSARFLSSPVYVAGGAGTPAYVTVTGHSYVERSGHFNTPGIEQPSSMAIFQWLAAQDFLVHFRTGPTTGDLTDVRLWIAWDDGTGTAYTQDSPIGTGNKTIGFRFGNSTGHGNPGTDTHWMCYVGNASAATVVDSGVTPAPDTIYEFYIDKTVVGHVYFYINKVLVADITTNIPTSGNMAHYMSVETGTASDAKMRIGKFMTRWK